MSSSGRTYKVTAAELAKRGRDDIPVELVTHEHMVYSSPATLAFNSPGAQGFGVKRAGLTVPGSVMLLVAPGCCGRNTTLLNESHEYDGRFFFLLMSETDLVTGRHLTKIPDATREIVEFLDEDGNKPSCVMICVTCVDALLGTDMDRVCTKAEEACGIPVKPCYMYALTREGRKPPMTYIRQSIYAMLESRTKVPSTVNIMGYFSPLHDDSEIYSLLRQAGVKKINEISRMESYEEYLSMAEANFNLVLNAEARFAAQDLQSRLGLPFIEMSRMYQMDRIKNQYIGLGGALGFEFDFEDYRLAARTAIDELVAAYPDLKVAIGEICNANPFELALAMSRYGIKVTQIYGTVGPEVMPFIEELAELSPDTEIYTNMSPTMIHYDIGEGETDIDLTIGKDARYYHPGCPNVMWSEEIQPFGFSGVRRLFEEMREALDRGAAGSSDGKEAL